MARSVVASVVLLVLAAFVSTADADGWRNLQGARGLARPGAPTVTLEVRASGGFGCGGGGCNGGVETRNVRGMLPSPMLSYFYSDRDDRPPGCPTSGRDTLFTAWTEVVIAPARYSDERRPACGIGMIVDSTMEHWVILRLRPVTPR